MDRTDLKAEEYMVSTLTSYFEYSRARRRAFIEEWLNFVKGLPDDLLAFNEVRQILHLSDAAYLGLQEIELDKIVGSVGRYRDFTRTFLPKRYINEERWRRVEEIVSAPQGLPPIEVYKVGDVYFVFDGNHRVSVARTHGARTIEAYVVEYKTPVPIDQGDDLDAILLKMERDEFLKETRLDQIRPGHNIVFTEPGRYRLVKKRIAVHKYSWETKYKQQLSYEAAIGSWYDNEYLPLVQLIRDHMVLNHFPDRTEADLYIWLVSRRTELEAKFKAMGQISDEEILKDLERENRFNPVTWFVHIIHRIFHRPRA